MVVAAHAFASWFPASGAVGVSVFFVLSGFLITSLLLDEQATRGQIRLGAFFRRRAARLLPAIVVFVAAVVLMQQWHPIFGKSRNAVWVLLYVGNWASINEGMGQLDHTWSLAVEEQFYFVWPLVVLALVGRVSVRALLAVALAGVAASLAVRVALVAGDAPLVRIYHGTDTTAAMLLIGCSLAVLVRSRTVRVPAPVALAALCGLVGLGFLTGAPKTTIAPVAAAVLAAPLLLAGLEEPPRWLTWRWLQVVGQRSYGLYLWHFPLLMIIGPLMGRAYGIPHVVNAPIWIAAAWGMACLSWRFVEQPAQRLIRGSGLAEPVEADLGGARRRVEATEADISRGEGGRGVGHLVQKVVGREVSDGRSGVVDPARLS